jgi:aerobic C4-dicarboxylate transport protein
VNATTAAESGRPRRRLVGHLWFWVLVAIGAGVVFGLVAPAPAQDAKWLAEAFIQLIQIVTGPVIFVTVVITIASLGNLARAGGLALRDERFQAVLREPSIVDRDLEAARSGEPGAGDEERFRRQDGVAARPAPALAGSGERSGPGAG